MSSILRALQPLKTAADAFFRHDLKLRRGERGLEIALDQPSAEARLSKSERLELERRQRDAALLRAMIADLATLLDEGGDTRRTMRALVLFESALRSDGLSALDKVPLPVLGKALEQFEGMVSNWSAVGLATLRSKMAVAQRERRDAEAELVSRPPAASGASTRSPGSERPARTAPEAGPSIGVAMQESRQDLEAAEVEELEFDVDAQLAAAYAAQGSATLPHPQAASSAADEAAALAAAYAALDNRPAGGSKSGAAPAEHGV